MAQLDVDAEEQTPARALWPKDTVFPKESCISKEFVELEYERLWPRVWQVACREEELAEVGSFLEYRIADQSILIVRSEPGQLKAYYNACPHRGRELATDTGKLGVFRCAFHGWRWNLDGTCREIVDEQEFGGLCPADVPLQECRIDSWGGFVFVNMDDDAEPLRAFLEPMAEVLDPLELQHMRFRWYKRTGINCNWKTALDAFNEAYHVYGTHPQLLSYIEDRWVSYEHGRHGNFANPSGVVGMGIPSSRLKSSEEKDTRVVLADMMEMFERELAAQMSPRFAEAAQKLPEVAGDEVPIEELFGILNDLTRDAALEAGAGWPSATPEEAGRVGTDWQIFPNFIVLPTMDAALCYRARPDGDDPDKCIFDIWSLVRYGPGEAPPLERQIFSHWTEHEDWRQILSQDLSNMEAVQRGMHSRGFKGMRFNQMQETVVSGQKKALYEWLFGDDSKLKTSD